MILCLQYLVPDPTTAVEMKSNVAYDILLLQLLQPVGTSLTETVLQPLWQKQNWKQTVTTMMILALFYTYLMVL